MFTTIRSAAAAVAAAIALSPASALAQQYPSKPIEIIIPFATGGTSDLMVRALAPKISEELKTPVVVHNRPGAGGNIATTQFARAAPDGYSLLHAYVATISINPELYGDKLPYDPARDLKPVSPMASLPLFLVAHPSVPANNFKEFIEYVRNNKDKVTYASAGVGGSNHLAGELLNSTAEIKMSHVPFGGSGPALNAVIGGHVMAMFDSGRVMPYVKDGRLKLFAVSTAARLPDFPDVPTVAETYPGFEATSWHGLFVPTGTPDDIVNRLNKIITNALGDPSVKSVLATAVLEPFTATPEEFKRFIDSETKKWTKVVRESGAKPQ